MKLIVTTTTVKVFSEGEIFTIPIENEYAQQLINASEKDCEDILQQYKISMKSTENIYKNLGESISKSKILEFKEDDRIYLKNLSNKHPLPLLVAHRIIQAEISNDWDLVNTYLKFWNKASKNPNAEARENMLKFVEKYNINLDKEGNLITFRFVDVKINNTDNFSFAPAIYAAIASGYNLDTHRISEQGKVEVASNGVSLKTQLKELSENVTFTDRYTRKMNIKIGEVVTMPREKCDETQTSCSRGLHSASFEWLKDSYNFGNTALIVLVNPEDVVSVPLIDNYGKMRSCSYFPLAIFKINDSISEQDLETFKIADGFDSLYFDQLSKKTKEEITSEYEDLYPSYDDDSYEDDDEDEENYFDDWMENMTETVTNDDSYEPEDYEMEILDEFIYKLEELKQEFLNTQKAQDLKKKFRYDN